MSADPSVAPKAFVSYSWDSEEHKAWVREFAIRLRLEGVEVTLDLWHTVPGDQLPAFMERAIRENDFVLIACTPNYKKRSDGRVGGVGYEGDVMTGEVNTEGNDRKFIPILRDGDSKTSLPSWLAGKYYIDLRQNPYNENNYRDLLDTLHGLRETPPPVGKAPRGSSPVRATPSGFGFAANARAQIEAVSPPNEYKPFEPITITGLIPEEVTTPRGNGSRGSGLYAVPFRLSRKPPTIWAEMFVARWKEPPEFTTMHRWNICRISDDRLILDGTTLEEVDRYHKKTLKLVLAATNREYGEYQDRLRKVAVREAEQEAERKRTIAEAAAKFSFDDD